MVISKAAIETYLSRKLDSYLWMKKLSQEQLLDELQQFKVKPKFKTEALGVHQLVSFYIGCCQPEFLFLLDMGLGKTWILLNLINQFQREKKLTRSLVTVPRIINLASWEDMTLEHSNLEPWLCYQGDVEEKWERLSNPKGDLTLIDYHGLHLAVCSKGKIKTKTGKTKTGLVRDDKKIRKLQKLYNFVAMDESHKAKNDESLRYGILWQLTKYVDYCYASTGTLFGSKVEDLFPQYQLVDRGETFGTTLGMFRSAFFTEKYNHWKYGGVDYVFDKKKTRLLHKFLQHRSIRYEEHECADLPPCRNITIKVKFTDEQREHYLRAVEGLMMAKEKLRELDAQWMRMRQIVAGFLQWTDEYGKHDIRFKDNPKLDALESVVERSGANKVVVCHEFVASGEMITQRLKDMGVGYEWLYGGTKDKMGTLRKFMQDPNKKVFVMNSESGGTGTDGLQKVARYLIYYESPVSPITRTQTDARVSRTGQLYHHFIYDLVMEKSVDRGILDAVKAGKNLYDSIVNRDRISIDLFQ